MTTEKPKKLVTRIDIHAAKRATVECWYDLVSGTLTTGVGGGQW